MRLVLVLCVLAAGCDRYRDCAATPIWTADVNAHVTKHRPVGGVVALGEDAVAVDDTGTIASRVDVDDTSRDIAVADDGSIATGQLSVYDSAFALRYTVSATGSTFDLGPAGNLVYLASGGLRYLEPDGKPRWATDKIATHVRIAEDEVVLYQSGELTRLSAATGAVLGSRAIASTDFGDSIAMSRRGEVAIAELASSTNDFELRVSVFEPTGQQRWTTTFRVLAEPLFGLAVTPGGDVVFAALFATGTTIAGVELDGPAVVHLDGETGEAIGAEANCHLAFGFTAVDDAYFTTVDFQLAKFALP